MGNNLSTLHWKDPENIKWRTKKSFILLWLLLLISFMKYSRPSKTPSANFNYLWWNTSATIKHFQGNVKDLHRLSRHLKQSTLGLEQPRERIFWSYKIPCKKKILHKSFTCSILVPKSKDWISDEPKVDFENNYQIDGICCLIESLGSRIENEVLLVTWECTSLTVSTSI